MATACKDVDPVRFDPSADLLGQLDGLTLLALVGILDPPRPRPRVPAIAPSAPVQVDVLRTRPLAETGDPLPTVAIYDDQA